MRCTGKLPGPAGSRCYFDALEGTTRCAGHATDTFDAPALGRWQDANRALWIGGALPVDEAPSTPRCECKICGARCLDGDIEHSKACFDISPDGGGTEPCDCVSAPIPPTEPPRRTRSLDEL